MSLSGDERKQAEKAVKDRRVHPIDAPKGSLRARLLKQMTAIESSSKVAVSDLIFNLCNDEGELVVLHVTGLRPLREKRITLGLGLGLGLASA